MEGLLWSIGTLMVAVVALMVYTVLRLKAAEKWLHEARETPPVKKLAALDAFASALRGEFTTLLQQNDEKHDRWMREQASLRTYIYRRLGKEDKTATTAVHDEGPDRITAEANAAGAVVATIEPDGRLETRRRIKEAYYSTRGGQ